MPAYPNIPMSQARELVLLESPDASGRHVTGLRLTLRCHGYDDDAASTDMSTQLRSFFTAKQAEHDWLSAFRLVADDDPRYADPEYRTESVIVQLRVTTKTPETPDQVLPLLRVQQAMENMFIPTGSGIDVRGPVSFIQVLGVGSSGHTGSVFEQHYRVALTVDRSAHLQSPDANVYGIYDTSSDFVFALSIWKSALTGIYKHFNSNGDSVWGLDVSPDPAGPVGVQDAEYEVTMSVEMHPSNISATEDEVRQIMKDKMEESEALQDRFNTSDDMVFGSPQISSIELVS